MIRKNKFIVIAFLFVSIFAVYKYLQASNMTHNIEGTGYVPEEGFVPNEETAIKIAEAIWLPIYGENIYRKQPFEAKLENEVWIVNGSLPQGWKGGVPYIKIRKSDCKVLKVEHGK